MRCGAGLSASAMRNFLQGNDVSTGTRFSAPARGRSVTARVPTQLPKERLMTEIEKLTALRNKLVARRRALVDDLHRVVPELLNGDSIMQIQSAIEAVNRALQDETHAQRLPT
jgi:hypothetical protein